MDKDRENSLVDLLNLILTASAESVQAVSCPFCHRGLGITFVDVQSVYTAKHKTKKRMSLHVQCNECSWNSVADGLPHQPPWVRKFGPKIQTSVTVLGGRLPGRKRSVS